MPADPERLVVAGQSLGGLSALYAALEFPELVSRVACQSGSFWWAPGTEALSDPLGGAVGGVLAERLRRGADLSRLRCAFDVGEHERSMLPHCELTEALTEQAGCHGPGVAFGVRARPGGLAARPAQGCRLGSRLRCSRDVRGRAPGTALWFTWPRPGSRPRPRRGGCGGCPRR